MAFYDPQTNRVRPAGYPQPEPIERTRWTLRVVYIDGHEVKRLPCFDTKIEAEEFRERYINQHLTGYVIRERFVSSFLAVCEVIPVKVRTIHKYRARD